MLSRRPWQLTKPPGSDGGDSNNTAIIVGTTVPAAVLGPFVAGLACKDPILCIPGSKEWISKLLSSAGQEGVLSKPSWLRYLTNDAAIPGTDYATWTQDAANGAIDAASQVAPKTFDPWVDMRTGEPLHDFVQSRPLWRAETYDVEYSALKQAVLEEAPDMAGEWVGLVNMASTMRQLGLKPFRVLGKGGKPLSWPENVRTHVGHVPGNDRIIWQDPAHLNPFSEVETNTYWEPMGEDGQQLLMSGGLDGFPKTPVLDSIGNPILSVESAADAEGVIAPSELVTLESLRAEEETQKQLEAAEAAYKILETDTMKAQEWIRGQYLFFDRAMRWVRLMDESGNWDDPASAVRGKPNNDGNGNPGGSGDDGGNGNGNGDGIAPPNEGNPSAQSTLHEPSIVTATPTGVTDPPVITDRPVETDPPVTTASPTTFQTSVTAKPPVTTAAPPPPGVDNTQWYWVPPKSCSDGGETKCPSKKHCHKAWKTDSGHCHHWETEAGCDPNTDGYCGADPPDYPCFKTIGKHGRPEFHYCPNEITH